MSDDACPVCGAPRKARSKVSHDHFFAQLADLYHTMPEEVTERLPTFEHFRKFCLIRTGWRNEMSYPCATRAEAERWARNLRPLDEFSIVTVTGATVIVWTAQSQSMKAMGKERFQKSKDDVLGYAYSLIGISPDTLSHGLRAA